MRGTGLPYKFYQACMTEGESSCQVRGHDSDGGGEGNAAGTRAHDGRAAPHAGGPGLPGGGDTCPRDLGRRRGRSAVHHVPQRPSAALRAAHRDR